MRHWLLVAFCAFLNLTLAPVMASRAGEMPKFEQTADVTACGQDPARPFYCGELKSMCLSPDRLAELMTAFHAKVAFVGPQSNGLGDLIIIMAPDMTITVFSLEKTGRACLLADGTGNGWNKEILKLLFLGDNRRVQI